MPIAQSFPLRLLDPEPQVPFGWEVGPCQQIRTVMLGGIAADAFLCLPIKLREQLSDNSAMKLNNNLLR